NCTATIVPSTSTNPTMLNIATLRPLKLGLIGECRTIAYTTQAASVNQIMVLARLIRRSLSCAIDTAPVLSAHVSSAEPSVTDVSVRCSNRSSDPRFGPGECDLSRSRWLAIRYITPDAPATQSGTTQP